MSELPEKDLDDVVNFLHELNQTDPETVRAFLSTGMPISEDTAKNHPTIQCSKSSDVDSEYCVRLVGLLNGLFECDKKRLAVNLSYPDLDDDVTQEQMLEAYDNGNFEVEEFSIIDKDDLYND